MIYNNFWNNSGSFGNVNENRGWSFQVWELIGAKPFACLLMNVLCFDIPLRPFPETCDMGSVLYWLANMPARGCFRVVSGELPTSVLVNLFRSEISATLNWASSNMSLDSYSDISWLFLCVWSAILFAF